MMVDRLENQSGGCGKKPETHGWTLNVGMIESQGSLAKKGV